MRSIEPPEPAFPWAMPACAETSAPPAAPATPGPRHRHALPAIGPADIAAMLLWVVIILVAGARLLAWLR